MGEGREKAPLRERLCHALDIPPDVFPHQTHIDVRGRNCVTVKGCGRVTVYTDSEIRFAIADGEVCIRGERLCCCAYRKGEAVVDGCVRSVSFEEERV